MLYVIAEWKVMDIDIIEKIIPLKNKETLTAKKVMEY